MSKNIEIILDESKRQVLAKDGDRVVGTITIPSIQFDWGNNTIIPMAGIGGVKTEEAYQKQGIAHRMMKKAIAVSKEWGYCVGAVSTLHFLPARHLYTSNDYVYLFTINRYEKKVRDRSPIAQTKGVHFRSFKIGDENEICQLWNRCYSQKGFFGGRKISTNEWLETRSPLLDIDSQSLWVATKDNQIIGYGEYFYHWKNRVNGEVLVERGDLSSDILFGLISNLEHALAKKGVPEIMFHPSPDHHHISKFFESHNYNGTPAYVFQVALFDLQQLLDKLKSLFLKRISLSSLSQCPSILRIKMGEQHGEIALSTERPNNLLEISGSYKNIVRLLCGVIGAWELYLRSDIALIYSANTTAIENILHTLFPESPLFHPLRSRW